MPELLSDEEIEKLIAERAAARRGGNYARSDEIRANLLKAGVILEDTKAGTRWKRKIIMRNLRISLPLLARPNLFGGD